MKNKVLAFDYMLTLFKRWHEETAPAGVDFTSLSRLSVLKLLFFASAPKDDKDENNLLGIFDEFYALPYGPVESDLYTAIKLGQLPNYEVKERSINIINPNPTYNNLDTETKSLIEGEIEQLKVKNKDLIIKSAFDLVDISHQWESWQTAYGFAQFLGKQSYKMTPESIKDDRNKFFGN
ncbi:MAG: hypothetical protein BGN96_09125 [Bacteroidales bacterium 45-6]|nr:MAG: hypothetical protein BGN96_09125 [Bacteroidales bacterium 45-6]